MFNASVFALLMDDQPGVMWAIEDESIEGTRKYAKNRYQRKQHSTCIQHIILYQ